MDSRFKIQGSDKVLLGSWILNLESHPLGFKKFFWDLGSWFLPPWIQEVFWGSWILNPTPWDSRSFFLGVLNLESYPLGFKKSFWDLESWILIPASLDSRSSLGSWILNPMYLGKGGMGTNLQTFAMFDHQKMPSVLAFKMLRKTLL